MFCSRFRRKSPWLVAVEISAYCVKLLQYQWLEGRLQVRHWACQPLPLGMLTDQKISDRFAVHAALESVREQVGLSECEAIISLSCNQVVTKPVSLESNLSVRDIEAQAWVEASKHFPDLIDDIYLDFAEINADEMLLVATRKENIEAQDDLMMQAGYALKVIDVNHFALARAYQLESDQLVALIHINFGCSHLVVMQKNKIIYHREQAFNDHVIFDLLVQQAVDTNWLAFIASDKLTQHEMIYDIISSHIQHLLQFFYSSSEYNAIDQLVLSGEYAIIDGISDALSKQHDVSVTLANPFEQVELNPEIDCQHAMMMAPAFFLCHGLAMRGVEYDRY